MLGEPTNDLDTDTLAAMEDLLDGWPGTLIVVSHDRYLLERVTDHQLALLGDGKISALPGGVEQYLQLRSSSAGTTAPRVSSAAQGAAAPPIAARPHVSGPASSSYSANEQRQARKALQKLERQLEKLTERQAVLHEQMASASETVDLTKLAQLQEELNDVAVELAQTEEQWLEASEIAD